LIKEIASGIAIYTVAVGLLGLILFGSRSMGSVLVGGTLTYFNYLWLSSLVRGFLTGEANPRFFAIKLAAKGLSLFVAVGVLVALKLVDALPFIVGLSSLFVSVFISGVRWQIDSGRNRVG